MDSSPIGLHAEPPVRRSAHDDRQPPAKTERPQAPTPAMPAARSVSVDLPDPMPGRLQLDVDRETGVVIGRIVDKDSGRLIRQVPSDEALRLAASLDALAEPLFVSRA